uniref:Uncharacterized protein n=1 Tax=Tetranychus urticae TaxID=32264 RepID=T1KGF0_TETUR
MFRPRLLNGWNVLDPFVNHLRDVLLGNIIPKWNDLLYQNDWQEAINQLEIENYRFGHGNTCNMVNPPWKIVKRRIELMAVEVIKTNCDIEKTISGKDLINRYDDFCVATGPLDLEILIFLNKNLMLFTCHDLLGNLTKLQIPGTHKEWLA